MRLRPAGTVAEKRGGKCMFRPFVIRVLLSCCLGLTLALAFAGFAPDTAQAEIGIWMDFICLPAGGNCTSTTAQQCRTYGTLQKWCVGSCTSCSVVGTYRACQGGAGSSCIPDGCAKFPSLCTGTPSFGSCLTAPAFPSGNMCSGGCGPMVANPQQSCLIYDCT